MKRIFMVLAVAALMAAMMVVMAAPAFAKPPSHANVGLDKGYDKSEGKAPPPCGVDVDLDGAIDRNC